MGKFRQFAHIFLYKLYNRGDKMEDNVLLRFLQSLTGGNNSPEQSPQEEDTGTYQMDSAMVSQNAPQQQIDPASLGKYEQPFNELVAGGMPIQEAYDVIMEQIQADQSAYQAPQQENPMQAKIASDPQALQASQRYGVYGRTN